MSHRAEYRHVRLNRFHRSAHCWRRRSDFERQRRNRPHPPRPAAAAGGLESSLRPRRQGDWSMPGGRLEWGETLHEAILREVKEETGLTVEIVAPIETVDSITRDEAGAVQRHYVLVDYAARATGGALRAGSDAVDARWVPIAAL